MNDELRKQRAEEGYNLAREYCAFREGIIRAKRHENISGSDLIVMPTLSEWLSALALNRQADALEKQNELMEDARQRRERERKSIGNVQMKLPKGMI